jgi:hypothetical protein
MPKNKTMYAYFYRANSADWKHHASSLPKAKQQVEPNKIQKSWFFYNPYHSNAVLSSFMGQKLHVHNTAIDQNTRFS